MNPLLKTIRPPQAVDAMVQAVETFLPEKDALYADPFCGTAEVPFTLSRQNCILSDTNPHFINFYKHVKNGTFLKGRNELSIETGTKRRDWNENRSKFNKLLEKGEIDTADAAQLTFYLCHISTTFIFDTIDPNDPSTQVVFMGDHDPLNTLPDVDWQAARELMQNWTLLNLADYNQFFENEDIQEDTSLVVSAPIAHRRQWDGKTEWTETDHEALRDRLGRHQGAVLLFHPKRSSIQRIYSVWRNSRTNTRVFEALPR